MKLHIIRIFVGLAAFFATNLCYGQDNHQLSIANGFMNEIKTFLTEEGFSPKIEDGYINFKKEGLGFHIQITGTGPYIYQFYVDGVRQLWISFLTIQMGMLLKFGCKTQHI